MAAMAGNGGNPPPSGKPIGVRAQCNEEGSGSESVDEFVVVATSRRGKGTGLVVLHFGAQSGSGIFLWKTLPIVVMPALSGVATMSCCWRVCSRLVIVGV